VRSRCRAQFNGSARWEERDGLTASVSSANSWLKVELQTVMRFQAAGILPAVEPARPARRTKHASVQKPSEFPQPPERSCAHSGRQDAALYVRRDA